MDLLLVKTSARSRIIKSRMRASIRLTTLAWHRRFSPRLSSSEVASVERVSMLRVNALTDETDSGDVIEGEIETFGAMVVE